MNEEWEKVISKLSEIYGVEGKQGLKELIRRDLRFWFKYYRKTLNKEDNNVPLENLTKGLIVYRIILDLEERLQKGEKINGELMTEMKANLELFENSLPLVNLLNQTFKVLNLNYFFVGLEKLDVEILSHENIEYLVGNVISEELRISC